MQVAYQFPELVGRLGLVASGGLGREVSVFLRAVTLPGSELVLPLIASRLVLDGGAAISRALGRVGLQAGSDLAEIAADRSLNQLGARRAFGTPPRGDRRRRRAHRRARPALPRRGGALAHRLGRRST